MRLTLESERSIFKSLLQAAPDGILVCDAEGIIMLASDECVPLFGYEAAELVGQSVEMLVPDYVQGQHAALREGYFACPHRRPMGVGFDLVAKRKDGSTVPVEISLSPFEIDGEPCAISVVRDVTDLRQLHRDLKHFNEELQRSNAELEKFAYVASHDLQEPLRMVSGYTQLLQRRYGEQLDTDANEYIAYAVDGVKRMQALINDLLAYSRLSTHSKVFRSVDLAEVMRAVLANLEVAAAEAQARIIVDPLPEVPGDAVQLTQVLQNLLSNAMKFRDASRPLVVHVSAERDGADWRFAVEDNGIGIEPQYADRIFVIFQRLHTLDKYPGTGIGLAICKKVVERHQGRIWFESTPGEGTTFYFTLPTAEATF